MNDAIPTHRRTITIEGFDVDDGFDMVGTLTDERPWASGDRNVPTLHHLSLRLTVNASTLTVTDAVASMSDYPHDECPSIEPAYRELIGLSIARGYTRSVQDRLGRQNGCSHLEFLARAMGPATIQMLSSSARRQGRRALRDSDAQHSGGDWLANTCHVWALGGVGMQKEAMGWHPGADRYPAPSVVELRRRREP